MICCILREKLLSGMSAEADLHVAKQSTSLIFNARIETPTKVWQVGKTCTCKKKKVRIEFIFNRNDTKCY